MVKKKGRVPPDLDLAALTDNFAEQSTSGQVKEALAVDVVLPSLLSPRGQFLRLEKCVLRNATLSDTKAQGLRARDCMVEDSDLANIDLTGSLLERVEICATRLTGAACAEARFKSVLFRECKLDLSSMRMATLESCVFENCNLAEADFYSADLSENVFRACDLSRADISHAKLKGADIRNCRIDGMRGMPADTEGLMISADQAPLLITLFGIKVLW
jgi:uncharacterized protein YjbI with pentapeptide repeats